MREVAEPLPGGLFMRYKQYRNGSNYAYLIWDEKSREAAVFDPVAPNEIMRDVYRENITITSLFNTHWHQDHTSGNDLIKRFHEDITTYGCKEETKGSNALLQHNDEISIGSISITALYTPGHTRAGFTYLVDNQFLVTGDTLFHSGCGNCNFGGDVDTLYRTFEETYAPLDDELIIWCGHDYTEINFPFSIHLSPRNRFLKEKYASIQQQRKKGEEPLSTLGEERRYNPFLKAHSEELQQDVLKFTGKMHPLGLPLFKAVRDLKDHF